MMPDSVFQVFTVLLFLFSFCLPALLMLFFYARVSLISQRLRMIDGLYQVISYIKKKVRHSLVESAIPVRRISATILIVVVCYFICWTP